MASRTCFRSVAALLLLMLSGLSAVQAAEEVLRQIPDNALVIVVVKNMSQASSEIDQIAQKLQLPAAPNLLQMAKQQLGVEAGLADEGDMALVVVNSSKGAPFPVVFVRTTDYAQLLAQFKPVEKEGAIRRVSTGVSESLIGNKGSYAVFAPATFREGLQQVLDSSQSVTIDPQTQHLAQDASVYAVVTKTGVQVLVQHASAGLAMAKQQFAEAGQQNETLLAGLAVYDALFKWASAEVSEVSLALKVTDQAIQLSNRFSFQKMRTLAGSPKGDARSLLGALPTWPYIAAFAGTVNDPQLMERWVQWSVRMMKSMGGQQPLSEEQLEKLVESSRRSMQGVRGLAFTFGVPRAGGSIYRRMGMVMDVEDSKAYLENYIASMQQMRQITETNRAIPYRLITAEKAKVAGVDGMKVVMEVRLESLGAGSPELKQVLEKMYGKEGKIAVFAAPIGQRRVALAYDSEESLREVMQAARGSQPADQQIRATSSLLPQTAQFVGFLSVEGTVQFAQRMVTLIAPDAQQQLPEIPPFPASPPVGYSLEYNADALQGDLIVPSGTLSAMGQYIKTVQEMDR